MPTSNNFFTFQDGMVVQKGKTYVVEFYENSKQIMVPEEHAREIAYSCDLNIQDVAILLGYIEYARSEVNKGNGKRTRKMPVEVIRDALPVVLQYGGIESVIDKISQLKYYEIRDVFYSKDPIGELERFI